MTFLYACHFSNGHIKVGRSIHPTSRIAAHAERVACLGVELVDHHVAKCVAFSEPAEADLIGRCAKTAGRRNKNEWFVGLDYLAVSDWVDQCAALIYGGTAFPIKRIRDRLGLTQAALAEGMDCTQGNVGHYERGQTVSPDAAKRLITFAKTLGHVITFEDIYGQPETHLTPPMLNTEGAEHAGKGA